MPLTGLSFKPSTTRTTRRAGRPFASGCGTAFAAGLFLLPAVLWLACPARPVGAQADEGAIKIHVSPDTARLRPLKDSATITVNVDRGGEGPGAPMDLSIRLTAPPPGTLISTDFPLIEGTRLIEMDLANVTGALSWDYVFPIRGVYRLDVTVSRGQRWQLERSLSLQVHENRAKTAFLAGFVAALFLLGFIAGRIFSAPKGVAAVLLIGLLYGAAGSGSLGAAAVGTTAFEGTLTVTPPRVGHSSTIRWHGTDPESGESVPSVVTLSVVQMEKGREIFRLNGAPADGALELAFHFIDASPHRVSASATTQGAQRTTEVAQTVHVDSATPSLGIRVWPVLLFMLPVLAGLAAGRISKRRPWPLPWAARRVKIHPKEAS